MNKKQSKEQCKSIGVIYVLAIMLIISAIGMVIIISKYNLLTEQNKIMQLNISNYQNELVIYKNKLKIYNLSVIAWQDMYNNCYTELKDVKLNLSNCEVENKACFDQLINCTDSLNTINITCENVSLNQTHYSFGCNDWANTSYMNKLTKYRCAWDMRELDKLGDYYDPAVACQDRIGHWWLHCKCAETMTDIYGK